MKSTRRILFLVPTEYAALKTKGIEHMIFERDENGFFEKVITVHPLASANQKHELNNRHQLYEFNLRKYFYPSKYNFFLIFLLPIKFLIVIAKLIRLVEKENIQIIRATDHYLMGLIAFILAMFTKLPFCISVHSDYEKRFALNPGYFKQLLRLLAKWIPHTVLPKAHLVMPIRNCYVRRLVEQGARTERIRVIPHGVDLNFVPIKNLKTIFNIPANKKIISFVGRLAKDNYIDDMLKALERLSQIRNDFIFIFVGGGEMEAYILDWLGQHPKAKSATRLLGFQPYQTARSFRYISDVSFCLMGGFSLIEAGAAGSPIIAYDVEWHNELVENYVTGFLVPENKIDTLVESIDYLLNNPDDTIIMGENVKKKVFEQHDLAKTTKLKQRYYLELLHETAQS